MSHEGGVASANVPAGGVFISHVHEDKQVADAFAVLIQDVTAGSVPTYSSSATAGDQGIKYGTEWFQWIRTRVDAADHVVAILTPNSLGRPWILFEAGLGKAGPSGSVFGIAVGISVAAASVGPFAIFQNSSSNKASLVKLCRQLIEPSGLRPRDEVVESMVAAFLEKVKTAEVGGDSASEDPKSAAIFQALEDLKFLIRERPAEPRSLRRREEGDLSPLLELLDREPASFGGSRARVLADVGEVLGYTAIAIALRHIPTPSLRRRLPGGWAYVTERLILEARPTSATTEHFLYMVRRELEILADQQERLHERRQQELLVREAPTDDADATRSNEAEEL